MVASVLRPYGQQPAAKPLRVLLAGTSEDKTLHFLVEGS